MPRRVVVLLAFFIFRIRPAEIGARGGQEPGREAIAELYAEIRACRRACVRPRTGRVAAGFVGGAGLAPWRAVGGPSSSRPACGRPVPSALAQEARKEAGADWLQPRKKLDFPGRIRASSCSATMAGRGTRAAARRRTTPTARFFHSHNGRSRRRGRSNAWQLTIEGRSATPEITLAS